MLTKDDTVTSRFRKKKNVFREYFEALFWAVLLAFIIRSFIIEPYKIPSKSMVPTLLVGDHIFVNKFSYGLRIPGTKKWITKRAGPERGEVIVFIYPEDEKLDFIKRVVGLPGDHLQLKNGVLYINDKEITHQEVHLEGIDPTNKRHLKVNSSEADLFGDLAQGVPYSRGYESYSIKVEDLMGAKHLMQHSLLVPHEDEMDLLVPEGHYFVMGDNRDQSADSRVWGFVPRENLKGQALFIWLSLDNDLGGIRFNRFAKEII